MAEKNGWKTTKDSITGNWTLECKDKDLQGDYNFNTQEKTITVDCANKNFTGNLIVDVKARDAIDKYATTSIRYSDSVTPSILFSSEKDNKIVTSAVSKNGSFEIAYMLGWIQNTTRYYNFTSNQAQIYSDMYFNPITYTVQDSQRTGTSGNYVIKHDTKYLKIINDSEFTDEVDFGRFTARFSNFTLSNNSVTTSGYYNEYKMDDVFILVDAYNGENYFSAEIPLKVGGALFMRSGQWYSYTQPGSTSLPIITSSDFKTEDIYRLYIVIPDVYTSQDVQGGDYNGIGRTATITQTSVYLSQ